MVKVKLKAPHRSSWVTVMSGGGAEGEAPSGASSLPAFSLAVPLSLKRSNETLENHATTTRSARRFFTPTTSRRSSTDPNLSPRYITLNLVYSRESINLALFLETQSWLDESKTLESISIIFTRFFPLFLLLDASSILRDALHHTTRAKSAWNRPIRSFNLPRVPDPRGKRMNRNSPATFRALEQLVRYIKNDPLSNLRIRWKPSLPRRETHPRGSATGRWLDYRIYHGMLPRRSLVSSVKANRQLSSQRARSGAPS